jgi:exosortase/archaeosortase family protein
VTTLAAAAITGRPRAHARPVAVSVGLTLLVLWWALHHPAGAALFAPLAVVTAHGAASWLAWVGVPVVREATVLTHAGGFACEIDLVCTALIPAALLVAAIGPRPASVRARLAGAAAGVVWVVLVNQARLVSLVWLGVQAPPLFDVAHVWIWPTLLAIATAGYWAIWTRRAANRSCLGVDDRPVG